VKFAVIIHLIDQLAYDGVLENCFWGRGKSWKSPGNFFNQDSGNPDRVSNTPGNVLELFFLLKIFWKFAKSPRNFLAEFVCLLLL